MTDCLIDQQHLPVDPQVPPSAREYAKDAAREYLERQRTVLAARSRDARELARTVEGQLLELFGGEPYTQYRHALWMERIGVRDYLQPPEGLTADLRTLHAARKQRGDALVLRLGVPSERLRDVLHTARRRWDAIADQHPLHDKLAHAYPLAKFRELHPHILDQIAPNPPAPPPPPDDPHRFTIVRPPYAGWQAGWHFDPYGSDFRGGHNHFIDPMAGLTGHEVTLDNDDAGDFDFADAVGDAQIVFGAVAGPSFAGISFFRVDTDETQCTDRQGLPPGATFFTSLTSPGAVPGGQWVAIRAGTRTVSRAFTNDVEIHSSSRFQWLIKSVAVRIAP